MSLDDTTLAVELRRLDHDHSLSFEAGERYNWYRRRNLTPTEAYAAALSWQRNMVEQASRRKQHDTGAEREEVPDRLPNRPGTGRRERRYLEGR